ncbi:MAG: hypothetical protein GXX09_00800 [Syntrophomonadaceae bacterium]|nr:hypothetical protein [Syntrophomonadaceae bacterium]
MIPAKENGSAVLIILILALGVMLLAQALLNLVYSESMMASYHTGARQALYLAEAGIEKARAMMAADTGMLFENTSLALRLGGAAVRVNIISPDQNGLIKISSTAFMDNGIRKTVEAEVNPAGRVGLLARRVSVHGGEEGECAVSATTVVQELLTDSGFLSTGPLYRGYVFPRLRLDRLVQRAGARVPGWAVYDGSQYLTSQHFFAHPYIFVRGNVTLDENIVGCPVGSLLVAEGTVMVCPTRESGYQTANLNVICGEDISMLATGESFLGLNGYLHANSAITIDLGEATAAVTLNGILEGDEISIGYHGGKFRFQENTGCLVADQFLQDELVGGLVSYRETYE